MPRSWVELLILRAVSRAAPRAGSRMITSAINPRTITATTDPSTIATIAPVLIGFLEAGTGAAAAGRPGEGLALAAAANGVAGPLRAPGRLMFEDYTRCRHGSHCTDTDRVKAIASSLRDPGAMRASVTCEAAANCKPRQGRVAARLWVRINRIWILHIAAGQAGCTRLNPRTSARGRPPRRSPARRCWSYRTPANRRRPGPPRREPR